MLTVLKRAAIIAHVISLILSNTASFRDWASKCSMADSDGSIPGVPIEPPLTADFVRGAEIFSKVRASGSGASLWDCVAAAIEERKSTPEEMQQAVDQGCTIMDPTGARIATSADLDRITRGAPCDTIRFKPRTEADRQEAIEAARKSTRMGGKTIIIEPPHEKNTGCAVQ